MKNLAIVWFRQDLRLRDNPALDFARRNYERVLPVYIWDEAGEAPWVPGGASRWWLHRSLQALDESLRQRGSRLLVFNGDTATVLQGLVRAAQAAAVVWNRRYEPQAVARDGTIKRALRDDGVECRTFNGALWWEPWELSTAAGEPYKVFTPLWRRMLQEWRLPVVLPKPRELPLPAVVSRWLKSVPEACSIDALGLSPQLNWADGFADHWQPGEAPALRRLQQFLAGPVAAYQEKRDVPALAATSGLSPHVHWGEISPGQIIHACAAAGVPPADEGVSAFVREVAWREFSQHLLYHFPHTPQQPLNPQFSVFPWRTHYAADLQRWQRGMTGVPLVDAGMRQLWHSGWMHNRVRMVVASFLTKNLLIPWQEGAAWFWDTLVDADLGNNTQGWQWTAGCGADAAPYFRIFNPVSQGQRFDAQGAYVRRWVPELAALPQRYLHQPWTAPAAVLSAAGVRLGRDYPAPQVDLKRSRERALAAYQALRQARTGTVGYRLDGAVG